MKTEVIASIIAALSALFAGVISYQSTLKVSELQNNLDIKKTEFEQQNIRQMPFVEEQLEKYVEATEIASKIANSPKSEDTGNLRKRFWELYWGSLAIFEEQSVAAAMVKFGNELKKEDSQVLRKMAIDIAHACRDSIKSQWNINMDTLVDPR